MKTFKILPRLFAVFGLVMMFAVSGWGDDGSPNDSCDGELIGELNGISTTTNHTETGTLCESGGGVSCTVGDNNDYYYFTPGVAGTLTINSYTSNQLTDLKISTTSCDSNTVLDDGTSYSTPSEISVGATTKVFIRIKRERNNALTSYSLPIIFTPTPDINVVGVADGGTDASFGSVNEASGTLTKTYTIQNTGSGALNLTGTPRVSVSGTNAGDFTVTTQPASPVAATTGSTTFVVTFDPSAIGNRTALITIANNTPGAKNPYTFTISGTGLAPQAPPTISVPNLTATQGTAFSVDLDSYVTDANGDTITAITLTGTLPAGLTYSPSTHIISGTPTVLGTSDLNATATDDDGVSNPDSFSITVTAAPTAVDSIGGRIFTQRTQYNLFGDVAVIGNTTLCILSNGACQEPTNNNSNAETTLSLAPTSSATLSLPTNATVKWARLYWQGRMQAESTWSASNVSSAKTIRLQTPTTAFSTVSDVSLDTIRYDAGGYNAPIYSASADITSMVAAGKSGIYAVDNLFTKTGRSYSDDSDDGLGYYGAWTMVVVYEDANETKARNVTVFDGYQRVTGTTDAASVTVDVNGFMTPRTGTVDSKMYVFTGEGDAHITGDTLQMAGATYNTTLTNYWSTNEFNSRVDTSGDRNASLTNNNGIDIHKYDVGTTTGAKNIIKNNETGAKLKFTTTGDHYFPSLAVFSTQLYLPQMCYDYAIKQDGRYLSVDRQAYPVAQLDSSITSSPLDVLVYLKNKEADLPAEGIAIKSDVNNSRFTMTTNMSTSNVNGTTLIDRGTPDATNPLCTYDKNGDNATTNHGCTDGYDVRKGLGSLGSQEYIYFKYQLNPQEISGIFGDVNESLGLSIKYYTTAGGNKVEYPDYTLGGVNVPMCPPTVGYNPAWGQFNVVKRDSVKNNLVTQISRKPFDVDVIFDSSPSTGDNAAPTTTINTTVEVEMIDVGAFGDINASCANPDASVSKPLLVPLTFTSGDYSDPVPTQAASYYNFALQNGAFRVWYYTDSNNTLIQNWTAATNAAGDVTSIAGNLYQSAHHSVCATACSTPTSATCYTCMKQNYAKPLCSRDNLSVRPEAFDIRIKDYTDNNSTILDVSRDVYGYSPDKTPTSGVKINLAAGYDYRYDIRATGNETNSSGLASVPRYTRYFNKDNALTQQEYNASMVWRGPAGTACNAAGSVDLSFYLIHGYKLDQTEHYDQVGEYDLSMIDKTWTAVDQTSHTSTTFNGFDAGVDCVSGSNSSTLVGGKHGCEIGSAHTNGAHVYKNQEMYFKPAKFDISSYTAGLGLDNSPVGANPFVYMSNIGNLDDMNMSVRFTGNIVPKGFNDTVLSNYVAGCYAKDLNMNVDHNAPVDAITSFDARSISSRLNDTLVVDSGKISGRNGGTGLATLSIGNGSFAKDDNGSVKNVMRFNYDRNQTNPINPKTVHYGDLNVSYSVASDGNQSSMRADVNRSVAGIPSGTRTMNFDVTHAYGRVVPRGDINVFGFDTFATTAYYEVFNAPAMAGVTASILAPGTWFVNANHTEARDGNATISFIDPASGSNMTLGGTTGYANGIETYNFTTPFTIRQGYKAHIDTDAWLWHLPSPSVPLPYLDPNGPAQAGADNLNCLTHPCFSIIFRRSIGNTGSAKTESESDKNNKNSSTGGGWSTTREYAPSSR